MSIENELKKLTAAIEANTAAIQGASAGNTNAGPSAPATTQQPAAPAASPPPVGGAPGPAAGPAFPGMPNTGAPTTQPPAPQTQGTPGAPMTHQQAQTELTAIVQQLGDAAAVQGVMLKYGSNQLNQIPADSLFSLVQECKALVQA